MLCVTRHRVLFISAASLCCVRSSLRWRQMNMRILYTCKDEGDKFLFYEEAGCTHQRPKTATPTESLSPGRSRFLKKSETEITSGISGGRTNSIAIAGAENGGENSFFPSVVARRSLRLFIKP